MNLKRRKVLKLFLLLLGVTIFGKIFSFFIKRHENEGGEKEIEMGEFKTIQRGDELIFYNKKGEKVFTITKDGEMVIGE